MTLARLVEPMRILNARRTPAPQTVAAIDLGSNSFHMIVARVLNGQLQVLDRIQEPVRLAGGLDARLRLDKSAQARALACLERFGQRLRGMPSAATRVVGTNTLRRARNADKFLRAAERALGHPIEVISGQEEARLIYQGVARHAPGDDGRRLVVDIGGGSTEFIIGEGSVPRRMESLHIGCVEMSRRYFPKGELGADTFDEALTAAHQELQTIAAPFRRLGWQTVVGSSGTIRAVAAVLRALGWMEDAVTPALLVRLQEQLIAAGNTRQLNLPDLNAERVPVFAGGFVILRASMEALGIERLVASDGALREGLLYDLVGRLGEDDVRRGTIASLTARYHVDVAQAARVERTARALFEQAREAWKFTDEDGHALAWAARLHEIGLAIAHTKYHKHGAYLVEHSELPGFSYQEQRLLAALIGGHRRRLAMEVFAGLPKPQARTARRACVLLRLAVLLHRARIDQELPAIDIGVHKRKVRLRFPRNWLKRQPLTMADLAQEAKYLDAVGYRLDYA